ncbi:IS66 family transposase [Sneathiella sp.]|uniref:IS66 family transposase n=1 Tax=Sneathiella sp. TaxID=1964365 RepID=UPI002635AFE7|nr:IS66 family transposase [Sneathiella sp.]MDF2369072.1 IS66 family transposase [Sneathiella sp.]
MQIDLNNLPSDTALLQRLVLDMTRVMTHRDEEINRLRQIIKQLQRAQYGRRSERLDPDQLALALEELDTDIAEVIESGPVPPVAERTPAQRKPLPDHLIRKEVLLDIEEGGCSRCGGPLREIGESVSEMLDWVPATLRVIRIRRPKYACRQCETVAQASAPQRIITGGYATPALIAQVLISKYCDHLPLYRQSQMFARQGVKIERSTLAGWVGGACWWLDALHDRLSTNILASNHLYADDTPLPVLDPGRRRTKTGRLWVYARNERGWAGRDPPAAVYFYEPDRRAQRPKQHLKDYRGVLHVDGYIGFEQLTRDGRIVLAACWAHARRKFYEIAKADGSPIADEVVRRIAGLYALEAKIRGKTPEERLAVRQATARPLIMELRQWLEAQLPRISRSGKLAEAIRYALIRWNGLSRFLEDGCVELDTNPVERAIRPVALGRKNHLFAGSDRGARRWATVCSPVETTKLNKVEPYIWLTDVLQRMVDDHPVNRLDELPPWNWKAQNPVNN